jgi:ABC-2 type transport system permease protein
MADVDSIRGWSAAQSRAQYAAVAWLRWRIFLNQFRRKGGVGELVARLLVLPFAAAILIGPTVLAGFLAGYFASSGHMERIAWILWGAFFFCQLLNIQLGQPGTTFDPTQLIRFPLRVNNYIAIRLFFGLLAPANISGTLIAFAVAVGVTVVLPGLWLYAFTAMAAFAAANVLFSRMVFAWIDRWLATRRAREVFTGLIFLFSIGVQWANFTFNPAYNHHRHGVVGAQQKLNTASRVYDRALPFLHAMPPNLIASALGAAKLHLPLRFLAETLGCALYAAVFFAVFAWRTRIEYRGENLSDQANAVAPAPVRPARTAAAVVMPAMPAPLASPNAQVRPIVLGISSAAVAVLGKEFLTLRRNTGILYGVVTPMVIVFLFAWKMASGYHASWIFPAALAYAMIGLAPLSYNSFGLEGAGAQFYFMAPARMRDIFLAKNIFGMGVALVESAMVFVIISYISGVPTARMTLAALLWITGTMLISMTLGNRRSITAPKKVETGRAAAKQASPLSALISVGFLIGSAALGAAALAAEAFLHVHWLLLPVTTAIAIAGVVVYRAGMNSIDKFATEHREELFHELCKQ